MRWESNNGYSPVPTAKVWGARKEFDSGEELAHFGVPGMKWGVRTKDYVKKGYNTVARRVALNKAKRKAEMQNQFNEGYRRGQRSASNSYFVKNRVQRMLDAKRKQEEAQKGDIFDRAIDGGVDKIVDKTGVDRIAREIGFDSKVVDSVKEQGKSLLKNLKDQKIEDVYYWALDHGGKEALQNTTNFIAKQASNTIHVGKKVAPHVKSGLRKSKKALVSGGKKAARAASKAITSGRKWLHEGDPSRYQKAKQSASRLVKATSEHLSKTPDIVRKGSKYAHKGARAAKRSLNDLLMQRPKRHR